VIVPALIEIMLIDLVDKTGTGLVYYEMLFLNCSCWLLCYLAWLILVSDNFLTVIAILTHTRVLGGLDDLSLRLSCITRLTGYAQ
jgi:hypothetical protein